jgi:anthranilate phosphoribosyltransferase
VATDYIGNAKKIEMDLIRGDFAIKREVVYKATISKQEAETKQLKHDLGEANIKASKLSGELTTTKQALGEQILKTKAARLEIWAMRVAVVLYVAGKIKGLLP